MALWNLSNPPSWAPNAIATPKGWVNPATGEVLVTIGSLDQRTGAAVIRSAQIVNNKGVYLSGDTIRLRVQYSEPVVIVGSPTIAIDIGAAPVNLTYASGSGTSALDFTYTIVAETGSVAMTNPATITGGVHDVAAGDFGLQVDTEFVPPSPLPMVQ